MVRLPANYSAKAPRYWERVGGDTLVIHVMGGMWGDHFMLNNGSGTYVGDF